MTAILGPTRVVRIPATNTDDTIGWKINFLQVHGSPRQIGAANTLILPYVVTNYDQRGRPLEGGVSSLEIEVPEATAKDAQSWDPHSSITFVGKVWKVEADNWAIASGGGLFNGPPNHDTRKPPGIFRVILNSARIADVRKINN